MGLSKDEIVALKKRVVGARAKVHKLTQKQRGEMLRAYIAGATLKAVAREYEVTPATVRHHINQVFKKAGIELPQSRRNILSALRESK